MQYVSSLSFEVGQMDSWHSHGELFGVVEVGVAMDGIEHWLFWYQQHSGQEIGQYTWHGGWIVAWLTWVYGMC